MRIMFLDLIYTYIVFPGKAEKCLFSFYFMLLIINYRPLWSCIERHHKFAVHTDPCSRIGVIGKKRLHGNIVAPGDTAHAFALLYAMIFVLLCKSKSNRKLKIEGKQKKLSPMLAF